MMLMPEANVLYSEVYGSELNSDEFNGPDFNKTYYKDFLSAWYNTPSSEVHDVCYQRSTEQSVILDRIQKYVGGDFILPRLKI